MAGPGDVFNQDQEESMQKTVKRDVQECEISERQGRVLARVLSEDLRHALGGSGGGGGVVMDTTDTATDLGTRFDFTFKGGDGDAY